MANKKKKRRHPRNRYKKYDIMEDIARFLFLTIFILGAGIAKLYQEKPIIFWSGIAGIIIAIGIIFWIYRKIRAKRYMKIKTLQQMKNMDWREFEKFIAFVFQKKGFKAKERQGRSDGGIDVDAKKDGQKYVIQCKRWKDNRVGVVDMRSFVGAMQGEGSDVKGIYVTTSRLTADAKKYLEKMSDRLELWDAESLESYILEYTGRAEEIVHEEKPKTELHPICEKCGGEMILREAQRGEYKGEKFYGCSSYPRCKHILQVR